MIINQMDSHVNLSCLCCGKTFTNRANLKRHLSKTKPCKNVLGEKRTREELLVEFTRPPIVTGASCKYCNKMLAHQTSVYHHQNICTQNPLNQSTSMKDDQANFEQKMDSYIDKFFDKMQVRFGATLSQPVVQNNFIQNNIQTQNNTFYLRSLGMEAIDHITPKILSDHVKQHQFLALVKNINFNPDKPENHNVKRMTESKEYCENPFLKFYADGAWNQCTKEYVLNQVIKNILGIYKSHLDKMVEQKEITRDEYSSILTFVNSVKGNESIPKDIFAFTFDDHFFESENVKEIITQFNHDFHNACSSKRSPPVSTQNNDNGIVENENIRVFVENEKSNAFFFEKDEEETSSKASQIMRNWCRRIEQESDEDC